MENGTLNETQNTAGGIGTLEVNTFLTSIGMPAEDALVTISDPYTNEVIEEVRTDSTGDIPPIELPAPPIEYSMEYDMPRPFNQYNVRVSFEGYEEANIINVQLYDATTAIQEVILNPTYENVFIQYPTLWGDFPPKIPESEIKMLPFPTGLVVLPQPVVPDVIVVHNGVPDDTSAANYTVGFKDYVKNVASSEIYATWPTETLRSNILAIISFTMNRVFTEWYRGKGYNFTITSSTAYDQAFNYGRNFYKEISDIVDEVFTTYITRPDIRQPLLTQYVDGRRVAPREGWLSQWGSKDLGDAGYSALNILKTYYGDNIILKQAERVDGVPLSFPGTVLRVGSRGEPVSMIQEQINAISNNYPLIPKVIVDGVYGENTAESVRVFQQVFNLPVTGEVNFPTWYKMSDVYVAVSRLA